MNGLMTLCCVFQDNASHNECIDDLLFDEKQLDFLINEANSAASRTKRKIRKDFPTNKWTLPINYMIDGSLGKHIMIMENLKICGYERVII